MPKTQGEALFQLIASLSKAEKRNFSLYSKRLQGEGDIKFLQLFNQLEKLDHFDEHLLRQRMGGITKTQLTNLRRNLYQHLLTSLRLGEINKRRDFKVRELIDYAHILYGKGLYLQALKLLAKAKGIAISLHQDHLHLEIVEFEKRIQSRHITRSSTADIRELLEEATRRQQVNHHLTAWSNLKLLLQRLFINEGHLPGAEGRRRVDQLVAQYAPTLPQPATFFERVYHRESQFWRHYLLLELEKCRQHAEAWVELFREKPTMIARDVDMYLRGLNHVLTTAFYTSNFPLLTQTLQELEAFCAAKGKQFKPNSEIMAFLYRSQARLNRCFLSGAFEPGARAVLPDLKRGLRQYGDLLDQHKVMVLQYKVAWLHLGKGDPDTAIETLRPFTEPGNGHLRDELVSFALIMFMMAHYQLANYDLLPYLLQLTRRAHDRMSRPGLLPRRMVSFFQRVHRMDRRRARQAFVELGREVDELSGRPDLRREFIFLDVPAWVDSVIEQRSLQETIRRGFRARSGDLRPLAELQW